MVKTEEKIFISLISDTTFKYLFKNEDTNDFFVSIIKEKFNIDLNEYTLTSEEDNTGNKRKDYRMDLVFYKKETNEYVIIEATSSKEFSQIKLNQTHQYLYRKASFGFDKGENYINPPKVTLIEFNNYIKSEVPDNCLEVTYKLFSEETKLVYNDITIHEIYLPKYHDLCYNKLNKVNRKLWMFSAESFDEYKDIHDENKKIVKELERLSMDEKFVDEYIDWENVQRKLMNSYRIEAEEKAHAKGLAEGRAEGIEKGRTEGINQGERNKSIDIAKNLLKQTIDINIISSATGLSIDEIGKLKN